MESRYSRPRDSRTIPFSNPEQTDNGLSDHAYKFSRTVHQGRADIASIARNVTARPQPLPQSRTSETVSAATISIAEATGDSTIPHASLANLACQVHRTTGKHPPALVGASITVSGDKLYVFGGRGLLRRKSQPTSHLYELDLITQHWTRLETRGDIPAPRYFHSLCPLGDSKLICYGGMAPVQAREDFPPSKRPSATDQEDSGIVVMSDVHIFDIQSQAWIAIPAANAPQGRYAHCAVIIPSHAVFASAAAPLSALLHNQGSAQLHQGSLGISIDGRGGAEMIIVGGQDSASNYIEQISVFNLRSLAWTTSHALDKSCGAYRSVVAPYDGLAAQRIGSHVGDLQSKRDSPAAQADFDHGTSMLIYSNYNFLDVRLELHVRQANGNVTEKQLPPGISPPGLRFPTGSVVHDHLIVSGTFLTSTREEYAIWALNLLTLKWKRIDMGDSVFTTASWNKGILWPSRNVYLILGDRMRNLADDYNQRRTNFLDLCTLELDCYGLCDNPRLTSPTSSYESAGGTPAGCLDAPNGGPRVGEAAARLGVEALRLPACANMDILTIDGQRIPANSHMLSRRWGTFFARLLQEHAVVSRNADHYRRPSQASRSSSITVTGSRAMSSTSPVYSNDKSPDLSAATTSTGNGQAPARDVPRAALFLPHTGQTVLALLHYLYTSSLPHGMAPAEEIHILCSLLQLARPYTIDGLLETTVNRLHRLLDATPQDIGAAAAIFNSAALATGGGSALAFEELVESHIAPKETGSSAAIDIAMNAMDVSRSAGRDSAIANRSSTTGKKSMASNRGVVAKLVDDAREPVNAVPSPIMGLQKRALRILVETRDARGNE